MAQSKDKILEDFGGFMERVGGEPGVWFIGMSREPKEDIFENHRVDSQLDSWAFAFTTGESVARSIRSHFEKMGVSTEEIPESGAGRAVYIFRMSHRTSPSTAVPAGYLDLGPRDSLNDTAQLHGGMY